MHHAERAGPRPGQGAGPRADRRRRGGARDRASRCASSARSRNINRTVGRHAVGRGGPALRPRRPAGRHHRASRFTGTAGQSFGAFLARGVTLELTGDANDYVGKGLSGGRVVVRQPAGLAARADRRTSSSATPCSTAPSPARPISRAWPASASRCATPAPWRWSRACGDHGCEYMTGGVVVVLGETGRNFAAGMSGGMAYVYDPRRAASAASATWPWSSWSRSRRPTRLRGRRRAGRASARSRREDTGMGDMLRFDAERLRILVERHQLLHRQRARPGAAGELGRAPWRSSSR